MEGRPQGYGPSERRRRVITAPLIDEKQRDDSLSKSLELKGFLDLKKRVLVESTGLQRQSRVQLQYEGLFVHSCTWKHERSCQA